MTTRYPEALAFLQQLIQTPSLPGEEKALADMVLAKMDALGFDEVERDEAGNVIGYIQGRGEAPAVMFNTHLDHVDPGPREAWPEWAAPYSGAIHEGAVWGRGASDIKGPLVAQLYGVAQLIGGERPPGDVYVTMDVQEEVGGVGARLLASALADKVSLVVVGEPSSNQLRRGHRGRVELVAHIRGRAVHASVPEKGLNPLYPLGRFLERVQRMPMLTDESLGMSSLAPTLLRTDQSSANVTPGQLWLTLDWRIIPEETAEDCQQRLQAALDDIAVGEVEGTIVLAEIQQTTYTGHTLSCACTFPAFSLAADDPAVRAAESLLSGVKGAQVTAGFWRFATDGGHFAQAGMSVVGLGPGDEFVIHTVNEHIQIAEWEEAIQLYAMLARQWPAEVARVNTSPTDTVALF